jgi:ATP-dependent Clp protease ATP-binding subunit ClpC
MPSYFEILKRKLTSVANVLAFLPFYFNVDTHLKHLFSPWKRIVGRRTQKGFSWEDLISEFSMNFVSSSIGFLMRSSLLLVFLVTFTAFLLLIAPVWLVLAFAITPFEYLWQQIFWPQARVQKAEAVFVKTRLLEEANRPAVVAWFRAAWEDKAKARETFALENLLQTPPLGRDWNYGFTPTLDDYTTDLTSPLTYKNHLIGRNREIGEIERTLSKSQGANAILVGAEGVGKQTIIDGLSQNILHGRTTPLLQNQRILELNMEKVLAERPTYEEKAALLEALLAEAGLAKNIILVIADFHKYISPNLVGDYSSLWEKYGERPILKLLALTTPFYYEQIIYHNGKLQSLFNKIVVKEISPKEAETILLTKALYLESRHNLLITYEAVIQVIERSNYYITHIPFPEKAINLLDEACLYAKEKGEKRVTPELVDEVLRQKTHMPIGKLGPHLKDRLLHLEKLLGEQILGQESALKEVGKAVRRSYLEERRHKPLVSLLFMGPTGVGKTEAAKQLGKIFFGSSENLLRFDMSFYQNKSSLADLIGSFEQENPGLLANAIREKPYSVLLIDEIEKADRDILNLFLTLLDEGYLVDGFGERVDCKNLIFIATSNAGAREVQQWVREGRNHAQLELLVRELVLEQSIFTPEFLNRFDKTLVFEPLNLKSAYEIGYKIARKVLQEYLEQKKLSLKVLPTEINRWIEESFKPENGAREIERVIRENLADQASTALLR